MLIMELTRKENLEIRLKDFRDYVYFKSMKLGEALMPCDVVDIILKANRSGKYKYILNKIYPLWQLQLLIDVYESCGFLFPDEHRDINRENLQEYF